MHTAVIGVGSNIKPHENIEEAKKIVAAKHNLLKCAQLVETAPIGYQDQADFINGAFLISTRFDLKRFNQFLKEVEVMLKRVKTANINGPRTIDLDIVVWDGEVIDEDFYFRDFLKNAVLELIPDLKY